MVHLGHILPHSLKRKLVFTSCTRSKVDAAMQNKIYNFNDTKIKMTKMASIVLLGSGIDGYTKCILFHPAYFMVRNVDFFLFFVWLKTIDCWYLLEPPVLSFRKK